MIDHLLGRPSTRLKRIQVLTVLAFWGIILQRMPADGTKRLPLLRRLNRWAKRFAPWQVFLFALTSVYTIRHIDALAGFGAPEPLARMYSRPFYRVTWINTALDAGFATAMPIKPKWIRDLASVLFSLYYAIYATEADEKLRRFRAFCTVDFMRTTWNKTTNPYIRAFTKMHRPYLPIAQPILIPRPEIGAHAKRPIRAFLFYAKSARELAEEDELVIDFVGGGFVCMDPRHHEERLRQTAKELQKPVLGVDYCKAPEYPFPYAIEECFDLYRTLFATGGHVIGMSGRPTFRVILSGDSAGGNLACGVVFKILEYPQQFIKSAYATVAAGGHGSVPPPLPRPIAVVLNYPALNFAFTSWMKPEDLTVLRSQSEANLHDMIPIRRRSSAQIAQTTRGSLQMTRGPSTMSDNKVAKPRKSIASGRSYFSLAGHAELHLAERAQMAEADPESPQSMSGTNIKQKTGEQSSSWLGRIESDEMERQNGWTDADKAESERANNRAQQQRLLQEAAELMDKEITESKKRSGMVNTRLTMTSMAGYFQDRILTQSMMRALAILYIGPRRQPDFDNDYFLSPIVAPSKHLADFPPVMFTCGEKDPICDDTVVMAGRIRQAKLARQAAIKKRGSRFGEQLRMSGSAMLEEDEDIDDWVQMRIIEGWSHGYLQMSTLLPEAKRVISFLANWMGAAFDDYNERLEEARHEADLQAAKAEAARNPQGHRKSSGAHSPLMQRATVVNQTKNGQSLGVVKRGSSSSSEDEEPLSFTPKARRSPAGSPSSSSGALPPPTFNIVRTAQAANQASSRSRPSSFSAAVLSSSQADKLLPEGRPQPGRISSHGNGTPLPAAGPSRRRRSFDNHDHAQTDALLVNEQQLLARRRQDAMSYMISEDDQDAAKQASSMLSPSSLRNSGQSVASTFHNLPSPALQSSYDGSSSSDGNTVRSISHSNLTTGGKARLTGSAINSDESTSE